MSTPETGGPDKPTVSVEDIRAFLDKLCKFDHNGECLVCDCWPKDCPYFAIVKTLEGLPREDFDVHMIDNAWYSVHALTAAVGGAHPDVLKAIPKEAAVRVRLKGGMLELAPQFDGNIRVMCYCCFGGDPKQGVVPLDQLREKVISLKDHYCPPWPG